MEGGPGFGFVNVLKIRRICVHIGKDGVPYGQLQRLVFRAVAVGQDVKPQDFGSDGGLAGGGGTLCVEPACSQGRKEGAGEDQGGEEWFGMKRFIM